LLLNAIAEKLKGQPTGEFKGRHFVAWPIVQALIWYLHNPLSYRDLEEMFQERGFEVDHFRVKKNMPKIGGFRFFRTARRTIAGFEEMLWLKKGFGFSGYWIVNDRSDLLARLFGLQKIKRAHSGANCGPNQTLREARCGAGPSSTTPRLMIPAPRLTLKAAKYNRSLFSNSSMRHDPASVRGEEVNPLWREMQRNDFTGFR
jgi:DDE domain